MNQEVTNLQVKKNLLEDKKKENTYENVSLVFLFLRHKVSDLWCDQDETITRTLTVGQTLHIYLELGMVTFSAKTRIAQAQLMSGCFQVGSVRALRACISWPNIICTY